MHYQFGTVVGDEETGGIVPVDDAILLREHATVAMAALVHDNKEIEPIIALAFSGRFNKSEDTIQTVWLVSIEDAGQIAGMLVDAAARMNNKEIADRFMNGYNVGVNR